MIISRVFLLSKSPIKLAALERIVEREESLQGAEITCLEPGETDCPQPVSAGPCSAQLCLDRRAAPYKELISNADASTLFVAIENYLCLSLETSIVVDSCLVRLYHKGNINETNAPAHAQVQVPVEYCNRLTSEPTGAFAILGMKQTLGEYIKTLHPECAANDWFQCVDRHNFSRQRQIEWALESALDELAWAYYLQDGPENITLLLDSMAKN
jgi:hypothetical protein